MDLRAKLWVQVVMNIQSLRPARDFATRYGVKTICFGPPGSAKTPLVNTAPRPCLLAVEPGMISMRTSDVPTWRADTPKLLEEFFSWWFGSNERLNFDTLAIDSGPEIANVYLAQGMKNNRDGRAAYGEMADALTGPNKQGEHGYLRRLYFQDRCHIYLICKQGIRQTPFGEKLVPEFPGKELNREVPHLYDEILHVGLHNIPGVGLAPSFQTFESVDIHARDRTGMLNQYEPCDLTALFKKCMS